MSEERYLTTEPGTRIEWVVGKPTFWARVRHGRRALCDVYWGTHGCERKPGHKGAHRCGRGCPPFDPTYAFGEDWHG